jgi:hypothetical protein
MFCGFGNIVFIISKARNNSSQVLKAVQIDLKIKSAKFHSKS